MYNLRFTFEREYYLIGYSDKYKNIVHYRIDRMEAVEVEADDIMPVPAIEVVDITEHKKQVFGMFFGEEERVSIQIDNSLIDAVMDKFGEAVALTDRGDGTAHFEISVQISPVFLVCCCAFGDKLKVVYPKTVVTSVKKYIVNIAKGYNIAQSAVDENF